LSRPASPHSEARHIGQSGVCTTTGDSQPPLGHHRGEGALGRLASALRRCWARPADGPRNRSSRARWSWGWTEGPQPSTIDGTEPEAHPLSPLRTARQAESQSASIRRETVKTARPASGDRQGGQTATRDAPAPFPVPSCVVRGARTLSEQSHASSVARPRTGAGGAARRPGVGAGSAGALDPLDPLEPDSAEHWAGRGSRTYVRTLEVEWVAAAWPVSWTGRPPGRRSGGAGVGPRRC
jgi:hypothetical protein